MGLHEGVVTIIKFCRQGKKKEIGEDVSQYHYAQKKYTKLTGLELRLGLGGDWQTIDCLSPERVRHGEMNMF